MILVVLGAFVVVVAAVVVCLVVVAVVAVVDKLEGRVGRLCFGRETAVAGAVKFANCSETAPVISRRSALRFLRSLRKC